MHYHLSQIPERTVKPRTNGMTMVMDKGLSTREVENFIEVSVSTDGEDLIIEAYASGDLVRTLQRGISKDKLTTGDLMKELGEDDND